MSRYYKKLNSGGELISLGYSPVSGLGEEITRTEHNMLKVGLKVFFNGEDPEKIKEEDWWK